MLVRFFRFMVTSLLHPTGSYRLSVIVDMKRRSPTTPTVMHFKVYTSFKYLNKQFPNVLSFDDAGDMADIFDEAGADCLFINTDSDYGGSIQEIKRIQTKLTSSNRGRDLCLVRKDFIIHPVQVSKCK